MVGQTRASPNGLGASGSDAPPPPPNMTIQEQFMVTQTEVMHQLLQTQQCRAYSPGTHARKDEDGLLVEFPCNLIRTRSV
jgi:hypothetical protein